MSGAAQRRAARPRAPSRQLGAGIWTGCTVPDQQRGGPGTAGSALAPGLLTTKGGDGNAAGGEASGSDAVVFALLLLRSPKFFSSSLEWGGK